MADPRGESNSYGGYSGSGGGGYGNKSGGGGGNQDQNKGQGEGAARAAAARAAAAAQAAAVAQAKANRDMQAQIAAAEAAQRVEQERKQAAIALGNSVGVPVTDLGMYGGGNYPQQSLSQAMALGQDFSPRMPNTASGWLAAATNPLSIFGKALASESMLGMNNRARDEYALNAQEAARDPNNPWNTMTEAQKVSMSRQSQLDEQLPNAYIGGGQGRPNEAQLNAMRPENISESQWAGLPMEMKSSLAQSSGGYGGGNNGGGGSLIPLGGSRDYTGTSGTFKPVTFRSGQDLLTQGSGLLGQAGSLAQRAPDEFNYNFDPTQAGQALFDQRSALLEPQFAQQNTRAQESMFGTGRLGLRLAGEGLGAGEGSGMMSPDAFGVNTAQSQALAQLAAQSTDDAFGQELQRSGLDLSEYNANQMAQQQQYANLIGAGQGMFGAGGALVGQGQQQQLLDQNYALGVGQNETARIIGQAQANQANYQPDPWLSGLTSLGTSFLGSNAGSGWLSGIFGG